MVFVEAQRQANESLDAVNTILQLTRNVVNESQTLLSNLENTEVDALTALRRTRQQHSAVVALNQVTTCQPASVCLSVCLCT